VWNVDATEANVRLVLEAFGAVERRDEQRQRELFHPEVEFHWPPELPYEGSWSAVWEPLQPTPAEQHMDPRVVGASGREVAVLWRQRGLAPGGERCDSPVLGLYEVRDGLLARAQMFYFDPRSVAEFLDRARQRLPMGGGMGPPAPGVVAQ
jgi:ketosteroid isomerase-like protein